MGLLKLFHKLSETCTLDEMCCRLSIILIRQNAQSFTDLIYLPLLTWMCVCVCGGGGVGGLYMHYSISSSNVS